MSDKKDLYQKLDWILGGMFKYSIILGDWGKYVWVVIYLGDDGYNAEGFNVKPWRIREFENQTVCRSCLEDIYLSEYDYTTDSYNINFNPGIKELRKNIGKVNNIIRNIETRAIDIYNIIVNSYLDPSEKYKKISIYFKREVPDYNKIIEEIKESTIFGQSIPRRYESIDEPVFRFMALKGKKKDINDGKIELSYPNYYRFSYIVYG
ncbi:MAG: hypothetical protein GU343_01140 [Nanoarchaeota archaeon]|jgi:hypothetical protein|nr:hypothetical protein [Nanoarchaeota archaeon]